MITIPKQFAVAMGLDEENSHVVTTLVEEYVNSKGSENESIRNNSTTNSNNNNGKKKKVYCIVERLEV